MVLWSTVTVVGDMVDMSGSPVVGNVVDESVLGISVVRSGPVVVVISNPNDGPEADCPLVSPDSLSS